jgi:hypothetical protein
MKEINDSTIHEFIVNKLDIEDFGYLVVPDDARLNNEALCNIKKKFKEFIAEAQDRII